MTRALVLVTALASLALVPSPALPRPATGAVVAAALEAAAERLRAGDDPARLRGADPAGSPRGAGATRLPGRALRPFVRPDGRLQVEVRARAPSLPQALAARLRRGGALVQHVDALPGRLQAVLPVEMLESLATDPDVAAVTAPAYALPQIGAVTTEGDAETRAALARTRLAAGGFNLKENRRIKVGVVSDGVAGLGQSVLGGDLPAGIVVRNFTAPPGSAVQGSDCTPVAEGRALLEIVHDLAPDAELHVATVETLADYVAAVRWLAEEARVDVVVDDIAFFNIGRYDGSSPAARVRTEASAGGVAYVAAVGNSALGHHRSEFAPASAPGVEGGVPHRFPSPNGTVRLPVRVQADTVAVAYLQWDDGTEFEGEGRDFDLLAFVDGARHDQGEGRSVQAGRPGDTPTEFVILDNAGSSARTFDLRIDFCGAKDAADRCTATAVPGSPPELRVFIVGDAVIASEDDLTIEESVPNGPDAAGIVTVGAYCLDASLSQWCLNAGEVEAFSSAGPAGVEDEEIKPTLVAPDGVRTTVDNVSGLGGSARFFGTSAAAPHVGAAAAMLLSVDGDLTPTEVRSRLAQSARPVEERPNTDYGWGRLDVAAAVGPLVEVDARVDLVEEPIAGPTEVAADATGVPVLRLTVRNGGPDLVLAGLTATARAGTTGDERFDLARACVVDDSTGGRLGCGLAGGRFDANDGRLLVRFTQDRVLAAGGTVTLSLVYDLAVQPSGTTAVARTLGASAAAAAPLALVAWRLRRRRGAALALAALVAVGCGGDGRDLVAACVVSTADALGASRPLGGTTVAFEVETLGPGDLLAYRGAFLRVVPASGSVRGRTVTAAR